MGSSGSIISNNDNSSNSFRRLARGRVRPGDRRFIIIIIIPLACWRPPPTSVVVSSIRQRRASLELIWFCGQQAGSRGTWRGGLLEVKSAREPQSIGRGRKRRQDRLLARRSTLPFFLPVGPGCSAAAAAAAAAAANQFAAPSPDGGQRKLEQIESGAIPWLLLEEKNSCRPFCHSGPGSSQWPVNFLAPERRVSIVLRPAREFHLLNLVRLLLLLLLLVRLLVRCCCRGRRSRRFVHLEAIV